jgi:hypothetical protein
MPPEKSQPASEQPGIAVRWSIVVPLILMLMVILLSPFAFDLSR